MNQHSRIGTDPISGTIALSGEGVLLALGGSAVIAGLAWLRRLPVQILPAGTVLYDGMPDPETPAVLTNRLGWYTQDPVLARSFGGRFGARHTTVRAYETRRDVRLLLLRTRADLDRAVDRLGLRKDLYTAGEVFCSRAARELGVDGWRVPGGYRPGGPLASPGTHCGTTDDHCDDLLFCRSSDALQPTTIPAHATAALQRSAPPRPAPPKPRHPSRDRPTPRPATFTPVRAAATWHDE